MPASPRSYHSPRRAQAASETQRDILRTARRLFIAHGYGQVTMADIARAAGTAVKTVYASVGTKTDVLHTLFATDIAESCAARTNAEVRASSDLESAVEALARGTREDNEQFKPSVDLLYSSMASDDGAREAWQHVVKEYRDALRDAAAHLVTAGFVAPHLDVDGTSDRLWFCFGLGAWRTLTVDCDWSYDDAERSLRRQAVTMLTDPG
ncbi:TetR/AcrR family transcriptional regulator [Amycolatopsis sp. NBC_00345]|uniref:TetR/AcrR family transcriptional regulator n=1 Tax=Amycolatopsis sp. NBC_00345 TaxID=2975955 RepID=UPI002E2621CB